MAQKSKRPAAVATAGGAGIAVFSENTASIAQTVATANSPVITAIRRGPGSPADWLVTVEGMCVDTPMRDRPLRRYKRFCNAMRHRFGVTFAHMPQCEWAAIVEVAIAKGGAS